jgi:hypothetical protein
VQLFRNVRGLAAIIVACGLIASNVCAQSEPDKDEPDEKAQLRQTRERMLARWKTLRAFELDDHGKERDVAPVSEPVFVYSESTRESGHLGTLWVWGSKGRPAALLSQNKAFGEAVWGFELLALSEGVSVEMHDGWKWSPKSALKMSALKNAPRAAETADKRLLQMKDLVREFSISETYFDQQIALRLLPRPVYRYQDEETGLLDGALFNVAHGTNPEVLVVIECRQQPPAGPTWTYGFLPLAGAGVTARLNGEIVWSKEPTRESKSQELYSTWLEMEKR